MNKKLLIADEDTGLLKSLGKFFSNHSFLVLVATSIKQTIDISLAKKPDIIISGFKDYASLLKPVKSRKSISKIPIILIVDKPNNQSAYITRPFTNQALLEKLNAHFKQLKKDVFNVLVVDDIEINRNLVEDFLSDDDSIEVIKSPGGKDSLEKLKRNDISVVLLDIEMPGMNGWETIKEYKKQKNNIPVIAMSGHSDKEFEKKCLHNGFKDVLTKPLDKKILFESISKYRSTADAAIFNKGRGKDIKVKTVGVNKKSKYKYIDLTNLERLTQDDNRLKKETLDDFLENIQKLTVYLKDKNLSFVGKKDFQTDLHKFVNLSNYFCNQQVVKKAKVLQHKIKSELEEVKGDDIKSLSEILRYLIQNLPDLFA